MSTIGYKSCFYSVFMSQKLFPIYLGRLIPIHFAHNPRSSTQMLGWSSKCVSCGRENYKKIEGSATRIASSENETKTNAPPSCSNAVFNFFALEQPKKKRKNKQRRLHILLIFHHKVRKDPQKDLSTIYLMFHYM